MRIRFSLIHCCGLAGIVVLFLTAGCTSVAHTPQVMNNPSMVLTLTIDSMPSGAEVFGIRGDQLGAALGTTPCTIKINHNFSTYAVYPVTASSAEEFLDYAGSLSMPWQAGQDYLAFKCIIMKEGYAPYRMQEVLVNRSGVFVDPGGGFHSIRGQHRTLTAHLSASLSSRPSTSAPSTPGQPQQQQQQQTVILPSSVPNQALGTVVVTSDVQDAEVYIDGAFVGNAPATLKLTDGIHIVEVKKQGHNGFRREVRVFGNSEASIRATLK